VDARFLVTPPTPEEAAALQVAARYFLRAGTEAATKLLGCDLPDVRAELCASLSDSYLHGAALCDGVTQSLDEALHAMRLNRWTRSLP
jgi:hypothetical protein